MPMEPTAGVTTMPIRTAGVTVKAAVPGMSVDGSVAVMVTAPVATPVASPVDETEAVVADDVDHVTLSVRFCVVRFEYVPVAVNCCVRPTAMEPTGGDTVTP